MKVRILIYPRREILDPQGKAVGDALTRIGFAGVNAVRAGKAYLLDLDERATKDEVQQMCERLLANTVIEEYEIEWPDPAGAP